MEMAPTVTVECVESLKTSLAMQYSRGIRFHWLSRRWGVDMLNAAPTRLKIVGVLMRGFAQHQFRALQGHPVVSDLAHDPIPRTGYGHIRRLESSVVRQSRISDLRKARQGSRLRGRGRSRLSYCPIPSWRFCASGRPYSPTISSKSLWSPFTNCFRPR